MRWRYARGEASLRDMLRVAGWLVGYTFGTLDAQALAERGVQDVSGISERQFRSEIEQWYASKVRHLLTQTGRTEVERHQRAGRPVVLLSAGTEYAVSCFARDLNIDHVLSTTLESKGGVLTGRCSEFCYGGHKVRMAEAWADRHDVDLQSSLFYTDSISDLPMLYRVGSPRIINPDPRLRLHATRKGWPISTWR